MRSRMSRIMGRTAMFAGVLVIVGSIAGGIAVAAIGTDEDVPRVNPTSTVDSESGQDEPGDEARLDDADDDDGIEDDSIEDDAYEGDEIDDETSAANPDATGGAYEDDSEDDGHR